MLFDDMLGNTLGVKDSEKFSAIDRDAFGELKPGEKPNLAVNFFTGKPEIEGLGYSFLFRNYRADLGKWQTTDPMGYPDGWNNLAYVNNGVTMKVDYAGASGTLVIHSSAQGEASSLNTSGHSWISYTNDASGVTTTFGTWGNNPGGQGNGLHTDLEQGRKGDATRSTHISDEQEAALFATINDYANKGEAGWTPTEPCSDFATNAWESATGEDLSSSWLWTTPADLVDSIKNANGGKAHGVKE